MPRLASLVIFPVAVALAAVYVEAQTLGVQAFHSLGEKGGPTVGIFVERESGHTIGIDSPWWLIEADDDELDWNRFTFAYGVPTGHATTLLVAPFGDQLQTSRSPDSLGVGVRFRALEVRAMQYGHRASETLVQTGGGLGKKRLPARDEFLGDLAKSRMIDEVGVFFKGILREDVPLRTDLGKIIPLQRAREQVSGSTANRAATATAARSTSRCATSPSITSSRAPKAGPTTSRTSSYSVRPATR